MDLKKQSLILTAIVFKEVVNAKTCKRKNVFLLSRLRTNSTVDERENIRLFSLVTLDLNFNLK